MRGGELTVHLGPCLLSHFVREEYSLKLNNFQSFKGNCSLYTSQQVAGAIFKATVLWFLCFGAFLNPENYKNVVFPAIKLGHI